MELTKEEQAAADQKLKESNANDNVLSPYVLSKKQQAERDRVSWVAGDFGGSFTGGAPIGGQYGYTLNENNKKLFKEGLSSAISGFDADNKDLSESDRANYHSQITARHDFVFNQYKMAFSDYNPNNVDDALIASLMSKNIGADFYTPALATYKTEQKTNDIKATIESNQIRDTQLETKNMNKGSKGNASKSNGAVASNGSSLGSTDKLGDETKLGSKTLLGG